MEFKVADYVQCIHNYEELKKGEFYLILGINKMDDETVYCTFVDKDEYVCTYKFKDMDIMGLSLKKVSSVKKNEEKQEVSQEDKSKHEKVNHPKHYTWLKEKCGVEVIDITRHMDFDLGNAIKYILRCGHKSEQGYSDKDKTIEDLQKAIWYINDKINQMKNGLDSK